MAFLRENGKDRSIENRILPIYLQKEVREEQDRESWSMKVYQ
jgi:hypothetical protein